MIRHMTKVWFLAVAALCVAAVARAQTPPTGTFSNSFSGTLSVWDVSGDYNENLISGQIDGDCTLTQDEAGKITGAGNASFVDDSDQISLDMDFDVAGSIKGAGDTAATQWNEKFKGTGTFTDPDTDEDVPFTFTGSIKMNLLIDQLNQSLSGNATGNVCVHAKGRSGCVSLVKANGGPVAIDEPIADSDMDGSWDLAMSIQSPDNKSLLVTGTATLSNGRTIDVAGKGKYQSKSDQSKLSLKAVPGSPGKGAALNLIANGANMEIANMTAKLFGQKPKLQP